VRRIGYHMIDKKSGIAGSQKPQAANPKTETGN